MTRYDAVVIGSGPAGLEAAVNLKIRRKSFLLFGSRSLSRKVELAPRIDNYLGLPGIGGKELLERFRTHLDAMEIPLRPEQVSTVYPMGDYFAVATAKEALEASTVILCTGVHNAAALPGEAEFLGRGVGYCATCDAPLYRGKTVAVLGYSEDAPSEAAFVAGIAAKVIYVPGNDTLPRPEGPVEVREGKPVEIAGGAKATTLVLDSGAIEADGIFILRETIAPASMVPGLDMEGGFIKVGADMATNLPGCFAAGDCTGKPHQYMRAAGQGQTAALNAVAYLDQKKASG